jgi:branched-chain amino acid transport system permease protein
VNKFKLMAFMISASLAGMAGATKTLVFQLASLSDVHWHMSGEVVLMTLLGGLGTILGPASAATIVTLQNELADKVGSWVTVIMG